MPLPTAALVVGTALRAFAHPTVEFLVFPFPQFPQILCITFCCVPLDYIFVIYYVTGPRSLRDAFMRRLEGGAGAVPRAGVSHIPATGVPGRPSARASGLPSRERGCTDRTNGGSKVRRDQGVMSACPVSEERSRNEAITAVERRLASARRRGARTPRQACTER